MDDQMKNESLGNFLKEDYSRSDYQKVVQLFSEENETLKEKMNDHWEQLPNDQPLDDRMSHLLKLFKTQIKFTQSTSKRSLLTFYKNIAAILVVPLLIASAYWFFNYTKMDQVAMATIHSPMGARTEFVLPDGTTGWLNSGSELVYPVEFAYNREVKLKGEAFFHVTHKNGRKFQVAIKGLKVSVLGTMFDVSAYDDDSEINVVLQRGKVKILDLNNVGYYVMKPNEKYSYDLKKNKAEVRAVDAQDLTLWTKGLLKFKGEPLSEVMKKLARWYNIDYEIRDQKLKDYNFQATFKDEQLDEILRMIALTTPMKYRIEERKTNKNGVYGKKKIIIERK